MLGERATELRERMDEPDCDRLLLNNTYAQFETVNRLVAAWGRVFRRYIEARVEPGSTILDVGCGGGDLVRRLAVWGERKRLPIGITAVDPDHRALEFAASRPQPAGIEYLHATAEELLASGRRFDFVVSNHLLHHLRAEQLRAFLDVTGALATRLALHNDLRRHGAALLAFAAARPLFRRSFIAEDGLRSIRRAFTASELRELLPAGWRVEEVAPYRNIVILER